MSAPYAPPLDAIDLALGAVGLEGVLGTERFGGLGRDDVSAVLEGFGRFASEVIAPTDAVGDAEGATFDADDGTVTLPAPIGEAYRRWSNDGWSGLAMEPEFGGGDMPGVIGVAAEEMFASANMALSLNPMLTQGAIHLLERWGTAEQKQRFLPKLVTGEWTGTMNLTESEAGSDVGAVTSRAVPNGDGTWAVSGTKIFITWGEHDVADNIIHLVLARTPGAPDGTRGLSLFVVPRNHLNPDGTPGERNSVRCVGLEHKLGIHASPTCVLAFDDAVGEMVGPENAGIQAMFTMMNSARLSVAVEGLAVSERAFQQARAFAAERRQGRTPSTPKGESAPIIEHPDVRRMLLTIDSGIDAMRLLIYSTAVASDRARSAADEDRRTAWGARADLLTPLAKAWSTDEGVRLASIALQVHGGMGYVEETGIAQRLRDARIAPIYEGTNGIQAIDLVSRKVGRDGGAALRALLEDLEADLDSLDGVDGTKAAVDLVREAIEATRRATAWILDASTVDDRLAGATPYLDLVSLTVCGGLLARQVRHAADTGSAATEGVVGRFGFFSVERVAVARSLETTITAGAGRLSAAHLSI